MAGRLKKRCTKYLEGVAWIALNDEPTCQSMDAIASMISVMLLADLFEYPYEYVARDVVFARTKINARAA